MKKEINYKKIEHETKEEEPYNGMTKEEYQYVFGLTRNHPNQELILNFIRERLRKTAFVKYCEGWDDATNKARKNLVRMAQGLRAEEGLDDSRLDYWHHQWSKIPTTQDKIDRVFAVEAIYHVTEKNGKAREDIEFDLGVPYVYRGMVREISSGKMDPTPEMVELGKELVDRANKRGVSYWQTRGGRGLGNFIGNCDYPRDKTGKLKGPGMVIVKRPSTEERFRNREPVGELALDSLDELQDDDEILYEISENWEKILPSEEE